MYLVNKSSKLEPVNRDYKIREKSQSLLDHPRILKLHWIHTCVIYYILLNHYLVIKGE